MYHLHLNIIQKIKLQILIVVSLLRLDFISKTFEDVGVLLPLLNHLHPAASHLEDSVVGIQSLLGLLVVISQQFVDGDECPRPAHPGAAVHQERLLARVQIASLVDQISEYLGVVRSREVGPLDGLQLGHLKGLLVRSQHTDYPEEEKSNIISHEVR